MYSQTCLFSIIWTIHSPVHVFTFFFCNTLATDLPVIVFILWHLWFTYSCLFCVWHLNHWFTCNCLFLCLWQVGHMESFLRADLDPQAIVWGRQLVLSALPGHLQGVVTGGFPDMSVIRSKQVDAGVGALGQTLIRNFKDITEVMVLNCLQFLSIENKMFKHQGPSTFTELKVHMYM